MSKNIVLKDLTYHRMRRIKRDCKGRMSFDRVIQILIDRNNMLLDRGPGMWTELYRLELRNHIDEFVTLLKDDDWIPRYVVGDELMEVVNVIEWVIMKKYKTLAEWSAGKTGHYLQSRIDTP